MKRTKKQKQSLIQIAVEFIKLQLAGNVLFWGTYVGYFLLHELAHWQYLHALVAASTMAHVLFFIVDKEWVFEDETGKRKTSTEALRFIIFMGLNFFINLGIIAGLQEFFDITPYIGQFIAGLFFTFWSFVGLKFWVFRDIKHPAIRIKTKKRKYGRVHRVSPKQKAA